MLRRGLSLTQSANVQLINEQSQIWRSASIRFKSATLRKPDFKTTLLNDDTPQANNAGLAVHVRTMPKQSTNISIGLFQKQRVLPCVLNLWHNVSIRENNQMFIVSEWALVNKKY